MTSDSLLLGPLLRHVDETTATVWVETAHPGTITVAVADRRSSAPTFAVHGHHYGLVDIDGLAPGSLHEYTVEIDGEHVWPLEDSTFPPSRIATMDFTRPLRLLFGSCRTSVPHDRAGNSTHGVDALRAYAFDLTDREQADWPDLVLFLGDQVYADETSDEMREFIASRRDITQPPKEELKDFEEYAHLYKLAWSDPANRWLLSTLPSSMIFDDHDIRDDWNTSRLWRHEMTQTSWWHQRIVGGLASYWVYQHVGNLPPTQRADDEIWQQIETAREKGSRPDFGAALDALAERADAHADAYRWSYARDLGRTRLVVVDSRAARVLDPDNRAMLDAAEMSWLDEHLQGGFDHLLIGTSLPFLMSNGLHALEAWNEAMCFGAWGHQAARLGEKIRKAIDLEHWAAFHDSFGKVARMVIEVAEGKRGSRPGTITFLSGDVHHSYVTEVDRQDSRARIVQAVCSPIRNPMPRGVRYVASASGSGVGSTMIRLARRSAKIVPPPFRWKNVKGPWFDNNIATLEAVGRSLQIRWEAGEVDASGEGIPALKVVADIRLDDMS